MATLAAQVVPLVLRDVSVTIVKPLEQTAHAETIDPNFHDLIVEDAFIPVLWAYRLGASGDDEDPKTSYSQLVNRMKESLRKVLVPFFPYAGRWISVAEGRRRRLMCDDGGVPFIEAFADADLDEVLLEDRPHRLSSLQGYDVLGLGLDITQARQQMPPDGLPCVFVQVTRFKSGGLTLGVTFHHSLTDGKGFFDFMRAWSDIATKGETLIVPNHDRTLAKAYDNFIPPSTLDGKLPQKWTEPWTSKTLQVNKMAVESIKADVKKESNKVGAYVSTLDCICAQVWRSLARLPSSIADVDEIRMVTAIEGRSKFYNPPLPEYYAGNVITMMRLPNIPTFELLKSPPTFVAHEIRKKILSTSYKTWISAERFAEVSEIAMNKGGTSWSVTSWLSFPIYEIDFGVGKPFYSPSFNSSGSEKTLLGYCCVLPPNPAFSQLSVATILFRSTPQVLEALQSDLEFSSFFPNI